MGRGSRKSDGSVQSGFLVSELSAAKVNAQTGEVVAEIPLGSDVELIEFQEQPGQQIAVRSLETGRVTTFGYSETYAAGYDRVFALQPRRRRKRA